MTGNVTNDGVNHYLYYDGQICAVARTPVAGMMVTEMGLDCTVSGITTTNSMVWAGPRIELPLK